MRVHRQSCTLLITLLNTPLPSYIDFAWGVLNRNRQLPLWSILCVHTCSSACTRAHLHALGFLDYLRRLFFKWWRAVHSEVGRHVALMLLVMVCMCMRAHAWRKDNFTSSLLIKTATHVIVNYYNASITKRVKSINVSRVSNDALVFESLPHINTISRLIT